MVGEAVVTLLLLAAVVALITQPLRVARRSDRMLSAERAELEAARDSKLRELRDAELDFQTGKLSIEDYAAVDGALRAEALEILRRLDEVAAGEQVDEALSEAGSGDALADGDGGHTLDEDAMGDLPRTDDTIGERAVGDDAIRED